MTRRHGTHCQGEQGARVNLAPRAVRCEGCTFCDEFFKTQRIPLHAQLMPGVGLNRVVAEDDDFAIVPSIGPLHAGHVLVLPRKHAVSALSMSRSLVRPYEGWISFAARHLEALYGRHAVAFEHGSGSMSGAGHAGACIEHAHVHVVPDALGFVASVLAEFEEGWHTSRSLERLREQAQDRPYLLLGERDAGGFRWRLLVEPHAVPSQYFRRAYAEAAGGSIEWNWRLEPGRTTFVRTLRQWRTKSALPNVSRLSTRLRRGRDGEP